MNTDLDYGALGPCEDYEFELMELVDGALPAGRVAPVERHVATCARCRAFVADMTTVSDALDSSLPRAALSADFDDRLAARIGKLTRSASKESAMAAAEREYRKAVTELRAGLRWRTALNALATASVCGGVLSAVAYVAPAVLDSLGVAEPAAMTTSLVIAGVAAFGGLLTGRLRHSLAR